MIRPFTAEDLPAVADLRRQVFPHSRWADPGALQRYMSRVFLENPWVDSALPSYVAEEDSELIGFVGVVPRPMRLGGRELRGAVTTQFMVRPDHRGLTGIQLVRKVFGGPQDCLFTDVSNESSRAIWQGVGGSVAPLYGLGWTRVLRTARYLSSRLGQHPAVRAGRLAVRPVLNLLDALVARSGRDGYAVPSPLGEAEPLEPGTVAECLEALAGRSTFCASYDEIGLQWVLDQLGDKHPGGIIMRQVRTPDTSLAGWFILARNPGGTAHLLHLVAHPHHYGMVLDHAILEAHRDGAVCLHGRADPKYVRHLGSAGARFHPENPGLLVHCRDGDMTRAVLEGRAVLSGLEGEWWMDF